MSTYRKNKRKEEEKEKEKKRKENAPKPDALKKADEKNSKSDVLQRLAQASVEGLAMEVAINTIMPGAGVALHGLKYSKGLKKAGKAMGKGAGKEGVKMLDDEEEKDPGTELSEDLGLELLTRAGGRGG